MGGITGFYHHKEDFTKNREYYQSVLFQMNKALKRRGPDSEGLFLSSNIGLAEVRLCKNSQSAISEPIHVSTGSGDIFILLDGEIYNRQELHRKLVFLGADCEPTNDAKQILYAYLYYGTDFIQLLNGVFSFAIWDGRSRELLLYRDRLGVKPLFYTLANDTFLFASEMKGLFAHPDCSPVIDQTSLKEVFGLGPAKTPGFGVFANVKEILPGHFLRCSHQGIQDNIYWELTSHPHEESMEQTVWHTRFLIEDSVKMQLSSEFPLCSLLSGGIDSSLVTAIAAKELGTRKESLSTYSFEFVDHERYFQSNAFQPSLDRPWVDRVKDFCHTSHQYLFCSNDQLLSHLFACVDARDLPCMADIESSLMHFCSEISPNHKVALTGECADEIFGGYPWFHKTDCLKASSFPWSMDMSAREMLLKDDVVESLQLTEYSQTAYQTTIDQTPVLPGETGIAKRRREIAYLNLRWFMVTLLDRMDRTSMYQGMTARVPLADYRILSYIFNVPWELKCPDGVVKGLLRKAGEGYLPNDVLYRPKCPYPKTYDPAYEQALSSMLLEELHSEHAPIKDYLDLHKVELFLQSPTNYNRPFYGQLMAGPQTIAYMLQINYWLKQYQ